MTAREIKIAYFAGLFDGEGSIQICTDRPTPRPRIHVSMTCKATVEAIAEFFGGTVISKKVPNKPQWYWSARGGKARAALSAMLPFMVTKRAAAEAALALPIKRAPNA